MRVEADPQLPGEIEITIHGPWLHTILYEIPILAIVSEVYFRNTQPMVDIDVGRRRLQEKIATVRGLDPALQFKISDYGTRRRFSLAWHEEIIRTLKDEIPQLFAGTSNVWLAMRNDLTSLGTVAHEYMQACQALGPRLRDSQAFAFEMWAKEYRGDLGIAISDTYGMDAFLRDFDLYFCKLFDGARQDSGDPFVWGEKLIAHYLKNRVDPRTKTLIFSDSLTIPKAVDIARRFSGRARLAFGIGTNLTNDVGFDPLQIVIKMTECNGQPVAKLSDSPGKTMSKDEGYLTYLRQVFGIAPLPQRPQRGGDSGSRPSRCWPPASSSTCSAAARATPTSSSSPRSKRSSAGRVRSSPACIPSTCWWAAAWRRWWGCSSTASGRVWSTGPGSQCWEPHSFLPGRSATCGSSTSSSA